MLPSGVARTSGCWVTVLADRFGYMMNVACLSVALGLSTYVPDNVVNRANIHEGLKYPKVLSTYSNF